MASHLLHKSERRCSGAKSEGMSVGWKDERCRGRKRVAGCWLCRVCAWEASGHLGHAPREMGTELVVGFATDARQASGPEASS